MPYSTPADVKLIVHTSLTDTEITSLIEQSDAEITKRLGAQTAGDVLVKRLSSFITAHTILLRQPESITIGEYREQRGDALDVWGHEINRLYRLLGSAKIKASEYRHIDEDQRYRDTL